jgi:hypothetical protein
MCQYRKYEPSNLQARREAAAPHTASWFAWRKARLGEGEGRESAGTPAVGGPKN